jgi:hypothetical protein
MMYSGDECYGDEITSGPAREIDPDEGRDFGELAGDTEDWLVRKLAEHLMDNERTVAEVAEYSEADWDAALDAAYMEEYEGRITPAIAARITCRMLQQAVEGR